MQWVRVLLLLALSLGAPAVFSEPTGLDSTVRRDASLGSTQSATPLQSFGEATQSAAQASAWTSEGLPPGFKKVREIGRGSYGTAVLAQQENTGRLRVLKISHRGRASDEPLFVREQELNNRAQDGDVPPAELFRNAGTGQMALCMEPVFSAPGGQTLALSLSEIVSAQLEDRLAQLPPQYQISPESLPYWNRAIDSELERLHGLGIHHNDIHLDNILMTVDEQGKPVAKLIDFGLSSTNADKIHPIGATLYQSYEKLSGRAFDPKDSDRYAARVVKAFLYGAAHGEKSTVEIQVPGGKAVPFPATAAAVIKAELKEFVAPVEKPAPPKPLSARHLQMLCEARYADLWATPTPAPPRRDVANVGR